MADDPPLPEYPTHSAAFGHLMRLSALSQAQNIVKARELDLSFLGRVRDDELPLLFNIGIDHHSSPGLDISRRTVAVEGHRRNLAATNASIEAIARLRVSVEALTGATQRSSTATVAALGQLQQSIDDLRRSADRWSRRITLLTVGLFALTVGLLAVAVGQIWR
jgi:hypothetical protein